MASSAPDSLFRAGGAEGATLFELWAGPFTGRDLTVVSFVGRETISRPFWFDVFAHGPAGTDMFELPLIGQPATLVIRRLGAAARVIQGVIETVEPHAEASVTGRYAYRIRLVPKLRFLKWRTTSRIFQNMSVPDIVGAVLGQTAVPVAARWALSRSYPVRSYCLQHQENDLAFVERLLAEEGIFYYFEHPAGPFDATSGPTAAGLSETLVFIDDAQGYPPIEPGTSAPALAPDSPGTSPGLTLRPADSMRAATDDDIQRFSLKRTARSNAALIRDYDFRRPLVEFHSQTATDGDDPGAGPAGLRVYTHRGEYDEPEVTTTRAQTALDQHRRQAVEGVGESTCRRLVPGYRFTLDTDTPPSLAREYVLTHVEHTGHAPELSPKGTRPYHARFRCVPSDVAYRPKRQKPRLRQVLESATVVGPAGEEIYTDALGRIKVQFHWDLDGKYNERSSCWIRVVQGWAGVSWGIQFIPRIGMEVMVTFLAGDQDTPIIIGCTYNATRPPPFHLPDHKTVSGIRTRTSPGGDGYNELSFEDKKGHEILGLHAQRDLVEHVRHDHSVHVGHDESIDVHGNQHQTVGGTQTENVLKDQRLTVAGSKTEAIDHDRSEVVGRNHVEHIKGDRRVTIDGQNTRKVDGAIHDTVEKDYVVHVNGHHDVAVGLGAKKSNGSYYVRGDYFIGAAGVIKASADHGLVLQCGESSIEITPRHIKIAAPVLVLSGSETAELAGKGPSLSLGDKAELVAKELAIVTPTSSLVLAEDAKLKGKRVLLNCDDMDQPQKKADTAEEETRAFKLTVKDPELSPYASKHYALLVDGKTYEGETTGSGGIEQKIPAKADRADITVWIDEWPTGRKLTWHFELGDLPDAGSVDGVQARLQNLGYYQGKKSGEMDDATVLALRWFQRDHGLDETGEVDDATKKALGEAHGH